MKRKILFSALILLTGIPSLSQDADTLKFLSLKPREFRQELSSVSKPVLIDVREFFEFRKSRIRNAVNMPSSGPGLIADTLDRSSYLFLYCTSGFRSKRVAAKLAEKGFIYIYSLDGGISAWKKEGFAVERKRVRKAPKSN